MPRMEQEAPKNPAPSGPVRLDPLARAAVLLEAELEAGHEMIRICLARGSTETASKLMSATVALALALAKLKGGETRQRVIVERVGGEGGYPENRKTNSPP